MPFVNVKIIENKLDDNKKIVLIKKLTDLIVSEMNRERELTTVVIDEVKPSAWGIGGKVVSPEDSVSFVNIKVSKGTTNPEEIANMHKLVKKLMSEIMTNHVEANYFIIDELNPEGWGFGDTTMSNR